MSSLRRILASRANGRRSRGPKTPAGKQRSSQNAMVHGLLARQVVLRNESPEAFQTLVTQHLDRLRPADGVEAGLVEEMVAAHWRMRRAWAIETRMLEHASASVGDSPGAGNLDRLTCAFTNLAASPGLAVMHRYEARLHLSYQRSLHNFMLLRAVLPNEPSPISGHSLQGGAGVSACPTLPPSASGPDPNLAPDRESPGTPQPGSE